ncbi:MAG TPA: MFS transporter, partial [Candidatus Obscuribacterales bacterium]
LITPFCGVLADRLGYRLPMLWGVLAEAGATALFCWAGDFPLMLVARVLQGAASACTWTAGLAFIAEHFAARRVEMMGLAMVGSTAGSVLGPTVGGTLFDSGGYALPFVVTGVMVAVDACLRFLFLPAGRGGTARVPLATIISDRAILAGALAVGMAAAGWAVVEPLLPNHLERTVGATAGTIGMMFAISTLVYGAMAQVVSRATDRFGVRPTICAGMLMMAVALPMLALAHGVWMAGLALCLVSMAYAFTLNPASAELGNAVDRRGLDCYAAVYAIYNIAYSLGMLSIDAFAATIANRLPFVQALLIVSGLLVGSIPVLLLAARAARPVVPAASSATSVSFDQDPGEDA